MSQLKDFCSSPTFFSPDGMHLSIANTELSNSPSWILSSNMILTTSQTPCFSTTEIFLSSDYYGLTPADAANLTIFAALLLWISLSKLNDAVTNSLAALSTVMRIQIALDNDWGADSITESFAKINKKYEYSFSDLDRARRISETAAAILCHENEWIAASYERKQFSSFGKETMDSYYKRLVIKSQIKFGEHSIPVPVSMNSDVSHKDMQDDTAKTLCVLSS